METLKKLFIVVLAFLTLNLYLPRTSVAQQLLAKADVTEHPPQSWSTPEEDIPGEKVRDERSWLSRNKWWVLLSLVVIGGAAAAGGGGGGGGGDDSSGGDGGTDTGSITGTW